MSAFWTVITGVILIIAAAFIIAGLDALQEWIQEKLGWK